MVMRRVLLNLIVVLALAAVAQALYWAPQLPERVASHFDLSDRANGWMGRSAFLVTAIALHVFLAGLFVALPLLLDRIPDALINMPNKDYWLAPVRRRQSLAHLSSGLLAIGCATLVLLLVIFQGVFALNARLAREAAAGATDGGAAAPQLSLPLPFPAVVVLYLVAVGFALTWMLRSFRKPA
ncbi:MAG TPA: DUF1648 domain-containing protein [Planctomycetota bacterium]|nr:DUF1648 domain-containing protein [Planctomycetota bacterium]